MRKIKLIFILAITTSSLMAQPIKTKSAFTSFKIGLNNYGREIIDGGYQFKNTRNILFNLGFDGYFDNKENSFFAGYALIGKQFPTKNNKIAYNLKAGPSLTSEFVLFDDKEKAIYMGLRCNAAINFKLFRWMQFEVGINSNICKAKSYVGINAGVLFGFEWDKKK